MENLDFFYFSGTGNTLLIVKEMVSVFKEKGKQVNLFRIEKAKPEDINLKNSIGLAFPVACQGTYKFIWDFIEKMPPSSGTEIFMVDTLSLYSGGIVGPLRKFLEKKGYKPIGSKEIPMPSNFYPFKIENNPQKAEKGKKIARRYALELLENKAEWNRETWGADIMSAMSRSSLTWRLLALLGKKLRINGEKCVRCGICVQLCPTGNITQSSPQEFPVLNQQCQQCMRCISFCPQEALRIPGTSCQPYRAVELKDILSY